MVLLLIKVSTFAFVVVLLAQFFSFIEARIDKENLKYKYSAEKVGPTLGKEVIKNEFSIIKHRDLINTINHELFVIDSILNDIYIIENIKEFL